MAGTGGARPGAGRKSNASKFAGPSEDVKMEIVSRLPKLLENLFRLADGGYEVYEREWVPAGLVLRDEHTIGDEGKVVRQKVLAFPDLPPDQMVLIKEKVRIADCNLAANLALFERILGRPVSEDLLGEVEAFQEEMMTALGEADPAVRERFLARLKSSDA